jgi:hypothetical protein
MGRNREHIGSKEPVHSSERDRDPEFGSTEDSERLIFLSDLSWEWRFTVDK